MCGVDEVDDDVGILMWCDCGDDGVCDGCWIDVCVFCV